MPMSATGTCTGPTTGPPRNFWSCPQASDCRRLSRRSRSTSVLRALTKNPVDDGWGEAEQWVDSDPDKPPPRLLASQTRVVRMSPLKGIRPSLSRIGLSLALVAGTTLCRSRVLVEATTGDSTLVIG